MVRIDLKLADKSEWVKVLDPREFTVFVEHGAPPEVGAQVRIDLVIHEGPRVILRGQVISRHTEREGALPNGFRVALGSEEREKVNYLNGFVRGGLLDLREIRRLPLRLPVVYGGLAGPREGHTRDINEQGIFVIDESPLPEESEIHMSVTVPDRDEPLSLTGVVSHTVVVEDEDVPGMGIRFRLEDRDRAELKAIIDELERRFVAGDLPEDVLL